MGVAWSNNKEAGIEAGVNVYPLIAPTEVPTRESLNYWTECSRILEQFNAAGCIAETSKRHSSLLYDREVKKRTVILFHDVIIK